MTRLILALLVIFVFLGCTLKVPIATKYKMDANMQDRLSKPVNKSKCSNKSLKVLQSFSPSIFMSTDMYYVIDGNKVFPYSQSQWAIAPNKMLSSHIYELLRDIKLFKAVQSSKSRTNASWLLESRVEDFIQYYTNENKKSFVKLVITLSLIDSKTSTVLASKVFRAEVEAPSADAEGGVKALNSALADILGQTSLWFHEECK